MRPQSHESSFPGKGPSKGLTDDERFSLEDLIRGVFFQVEDTEILRRDGENCDALVDVSFEKRGAQTSKHATTPQTVRQSVAIFFRPDLEVPAFGAGPTRGIVESAMQKVLGFLGMPTVKLPDQPTFNKRFTVVSFDPDRTRQLFTLPVVDVISRHEEFSIRTGTGRIAVYRKGVTVQPSDRKAFIAAAREVADRVIESAAALPATTLTSGERTTQTIQSMDGWLGKRMQGMIVTSRDVNSFLAQAPPRVAPRGIRKRAYGASGFMIIWGTLFFLMGSFVVALVSIVGAKAEDASEVPSWLPYLLLGAPLLGVVILFFAARYRWRQRRILREGTCEVGKIVEVRDTQFYSGSDRQHRVAFKTATDRVVVRLGSGPAALARKLRESGEQVRLLVDPRDRSRALWVGGWAADAYE